jgi:hypothetical protein
LRLSSEMAFCPTKPEPPVMKMVEAMRFSVLGARSLGAAQR